MKNPARIIIPGAEPILMNESSERGERENQTKGGGGRPKKSMEGSRGWRRRQPGGGGDVVGKGDEIVNGTKGTL